MNKPEKLAVKRLAKEIYAGLVARETTTSLDDARKHASFAYMAAKTFFEVHGFDNE